MKNARMIEIRQKNIIWPSSFDQDLNNETFPSSSSSCSSKLVIRSDRGKRWMKRLNVRKKLRSSANFIVNTTMPDIPKKLRIAEIKTSYETSHITNTMLRELMCKQIINPLSSTTRSKKEEEKKRALLEKKIRRKRRKKDKKKEVYSLNSLEQASKRLDEIFTIKPTTTPTRPLPSSSSFSNPPSSSSSTNTSSKYRFMTSQMEDIWTLKKIKKY